MITEAQHQARKAIQNGKSSFWTATAKTFNNFDRSNTGLFQARKK